MATTTAQIGFEECVGVTRFLMRTIGVWPLDNPKSWKARCKFVLPGSLLLFVNILPQIRQAIQAGNDFNLILEVLTTGIIIQTIAFIKLLGLWYNKIGLKKIVLEIFRDWKNTRTKEQEVMWWNARLSKWAVILCYSSSTGTSLTYSLMFLMTTASTHRNASIDMPLFFKASFPFDTNYTPIYEIICFVQCFSAFMCCFSFSSFDGFFVLSVLHISGQLQNLKHRLRNLMTKRKKDTNAFMKSLKFVVLRHQHLVSCTDIIENSFSKVFLLQVIGASIALCLQGYQFVMIISESGTKLLVSLIFIVVFTIGNTASLFMYCYIAQVVRDESSNLFYAVYEIPWYELSPKEAVLIVIIMSRCKSPIEFTVGKFAVFSLEYFAKVVKTSFGYLSVLLAVKKQLTE